MINPLQFFSLRLGTYCLAVKLEIRDIWIGLFWDIRQQDHKTKIVHLFLCLFPIFPVIHSTILLRDDHRVLDSVLCFVLLLIHFFILLGVGRWFLTLLLWAMS